MAETKAQQLKKEFLLERARKTRYRREFGFYMCAVNEQHLVMRAKLKELKTYLIERARAKTRS